MGRRAFLKGGTLLLAGSVLAPAQVLAAAGDTPKLRFGLATDLHYADRPPGGSRYYRESLTKFAEAVGRFKQEKPDLIVTLGDLIDRGPSIDAEKGYLRQVVQQFAGLPGQRHHVLGNHCVENLTKPEYLEIVGQKQSYYSFDAHGYHFVILDACFRADGQPYGRKNFGWGDAAISKTEMDWLQADLRRSTLPSIVFVHQCLDIIPPFGVRNGSLVRKILADAGHVLAVLQGHFHYGNYQEIDRIHYCTLSAVIEGSGPRNNSYAMMDILPGDAIRITGFRQQRSYRW